MKNIETTSKNMLPKNIAILSKEVAENFARSLGIPFKNPTLGIEFGDKCVYLGYSSGLNYEEDGYTFEKEYIIE